MFKMSNRHAFAGGPGSDVITVGSTSWLHERDERIGFSNYGKCTDILAPGSKIKSVAWQDNTGTTSKSGTSMATPAVAGATVATIFLPLLLLPMLLRLLQLMMLPPQQQQQ